MHYQLSHNCAPHCTVLWCAGLHDVRSLEAERSVDLRTRQSQSRVSTVFSFCGYFEMKITNRLLLQVYRDIYGGNVDEDVCVAPPLLCRAVEPVRLRRGLHVPRQSLPK